MGGYYDVIVVGAGISGICCAHSLTTKNPQRSYAILEGRADVGGTWDLYRYPGIRSDSDMYTFGYSFDPWPGEEALAEGADIKHYLKRAAAKFGIDEKIQFGMTLESAHWSSQKAEWRLGVRNAESGELVEYRCNFLLLCTGYYEYAKGYTPEFAGMDAYQGVIVHPHSWSDDVDYAGRRVVVVGSGATAISLVPALAEKAEHVVMLQRTPTYLLKRPAVDPLARRLSQLLPDGIAAVLNRWRYALGYAVYFRYCRWFPDRAARQLIDGAMNAVGDAARDRRDFTPSYRPWDQRVCVVRNGDLFELIEAGRVSLVTAEIDSFTETGIRTQAGEVLDADLVVTATGFDVRFLGGAELHVDGHSTRISDCTRYRDLMFSDIPNLAMTGGYLNSSWTRKVELQAGFLSRLLQHMGRNGYRACCPRERPRGPRETDSYFTPGYVVRAANRFPTNGTESPWRTYNNHLLDVFSYRFGRLTDGTLEFKEMSP